MVITALTRNQVARKGSWVRIPPPPVDKPRERFSGFLFFHSPDAALCAHRENCHFLCLALDIFNHLLYTHIQSTEDVRRGTPPRVSAFVCPFLYSRTYYFKEVCMKKSLEELEKLIREALEEKEIIVDSVTYEKNSGNYNVLSVVLDKLGGIDLDTVVEATNIINPIVDKYDLTDDSYILDVTSKERGKENE